MQQNRRAGPGDPGAWTRQSIGGKEAFVHQLGAAHFEVFDGVLERTAALPLEGIRLSDVRHPVLDTLMGGVRDGVMRGPGAAILSGLDPDRYPLADFQRIFWALGTYLGTAGVQSRMGERMSFVRNAPDGSARRYRSDVELAPHTDIYEVIALACVSQAESGGETGLSSSLAIHDAIAGTRPDLLAALYQGYYNGIEAHHGVPDSARADPPALVSRLPVFSCVGDVVSCFTMTFWLAAARERGEPIPPKLLEAMRLLGRLARSDDYQVRFLLQPGEMLFWHDWTLLHARAPFRDAPGRERVLLRLWLEVADGRPVCSEIADCTRLIDRIIRTRQAVAA